MARIQSFPDEFVFCSKATTGGQMRKFQVPQYTQVGNAVPPLLGLALGKVIGRLNSYYQEASAELAESSPATIKARIVAEAL
jgi:DNA (cytosine-5)-methyltransferase 1